MKKSKSVLLPYKQHKEEQQNYRLKLELNRHNWLIDKFKTTDAKPTKREKTFLNKIKKSMQNDSGNAVKPKMAQKRPIPALDKVNNIPEKMQKITNNDKTDTKPSTGPSMPELIEPYEKVNSIPDYQVEPLALLHKTKLNKTEKSNKVHSNSEIVNKPSITDLKKYTLADQSKEGQSSVGSKSTSAIVNMEENDPKPIFLGVPSSKSKSWFDTNEQISSKHNLPLSLAPEMKNFRIPRQPTNFNQKLYISREIQTDSHEDMAMLNFLHTHDVTTVDKLKDIVESLNEENNKILAFLKTKGISLQMLTEIICDHDKEINNDDEGKLKKEVGNEVENNVSPEIVNSVIALSDQNKKILNMCAPKVILARIVNLNEQAKKQLEEVERAPTKQSVIVKEPVSKTNPPTNKQIEIPSPQCKKNYNFYDATKNEVNEENTGHLIIEDIDNQVVEYKSYQGAVDIGSQTIDDTLPQVRGDIASHIVEDTSYQVAEGCGSQLAEEDRYKIVNLAELPVVQNTDIRTKEEPSSLVSQEAEKQVALPKSIMVDDTLNATKRSLFTRRDRPQIEAGVQKMGPPENKRRCQLPDPRCKNRLQASMKTQNSNQRSPRMSPGFYLPNSTLNTFNNGNAGHVNQNMGFDTNNEFVPNDPYHPCSQNENSMVCSINNQCGRNITGRLNSIDHNNNTFRYQNGRNIANDPNNQNYDNGGYGSNAQYGNSAAYSLHKPNGVIKRYGPRSHNNSVIYNPNGQNNNVTYNPNFQNHNVTYNPNNQNDNGIFNSSSQNGMSEGGNTENSQAFGGFAQGKKTNVQISNNDTRGSMTQNVFWGSAGQRLPPTNVANSVGPPLQWPATSMSNLAALTASARSHYPTARISPTSAQPIIVETETLWQSRSWSTIQ